MSDYQIFWPDWIPDWLRKEFRELEKISDGWLEDPSTHYLGSRLQDDLIDVSDKSDLMSKSSRTVTWLVGRLYQINLSMQSNWEDLRV